MILINGRKSVIMIQRVEHPDDPNRCQGNGQHGQCQNLAVENGEMCMAHGGNHTAEKAKKQSVRNYNLTKIQWKREIEDKSESQVIMSLRDEIGIMRLLMEKRLEQCEDVNTLMLHSQAIGDLAMKINALVTSCHKMEDKLGRLLDKTVLVNFASQLIDIISDKVQSPKVVESIARDITELLDDSTNTAESPAPLIT